jgi:hypothetical protein
VQRGDEMDEAAARVIVNQAIDLGANDGIDFTVENARGEKVDGGEQQADARGEQDHEQRRESGGGQPHRCAHSLRTYPAPRTV